MFDNKIARKLLAYLASNKQLSHSMIDKTEMSKINAFTIMKNLKQYGLATSKMYSKKKYSYMAYKITKSGKTCANQYCKSEIEALIPKQPVC